MKSNGSTHINTCIWSKSDNSFKFDFIPAGCPAPVKPTSAASYEAEAGCFSNKGQGSNFLFNFKIPPVEQMETTESQDILSQDNGEGAQQQTSQDVDSINQVELQTKSKKKKKNSGKKQTSEPRQESDFIQVKEAGKDTELVSNVLLQNHITFQVMGCFDVWMGFFSRLQKRNWTDSWIGALSSWNWEWSPWRLHPNRVGVPATEAFFFAHMFRS